MSSADGTRVVSAADYIVVSTDSGASSVQRDLRARLVAASSDCTRLVAAAPSSWGYIYTSTDFGQTWTQGDTRKTSWGAVASSADGRKLAATSGAGIYTATISLP